MVNVCRNYGDPRHTRRDSPASAVIEPLCGRFTRVRSSAMPQDDRPQATSVMHSTDARTSRDFETNHQRENASWRAHRPLS